MQQDPRARIIPEHYGIASDNSTEHKRAIQFEDDGAHQDEDPEDNEPSFRYQEDSLNCER